VKLLLTLPPIKAQERYGRFSAIGSLYPPLGLAYLAAYAEQAGHEVKIIDSEAQMSSYQDIINEVLEFHPDLVGIQTYCTNISRAYKLAEYLKLVLETKIVLGGAQATLDPVGAISNKHIDFVIIGEGEKTLVRLLDSLTTGTYAGMPGLVFKDNDTAKINKPVDLIMNLDEIPLPARHLLPMEKYHSCSILRGSRTLNIITSRGCPYRCVYCAGFRIFGATHRFHSTDRIINELRLLKEKYGADSIQFYDDTFTVDAQRVHELCDRMIDEKLNVQWSCFTRVDLVDEELLRKMKRAGCYLIFYGLESGVQRILNLMQKGVTLEQSEKALIITRRAGIDTWANYMLGFPSETREETEQTIAFAVKVNPTFAQFLNTTPFPGTTLYELAIQHGTLKVNLNNFTSWDEVSFVSNGRTENEIKDAVRKAYRRFYLRPLYLINCLRKILLLPPQKIFALIKTVFSILIG